MSKEDLIPFNKRPRAEALANSAKGGRSKSRVKSMAAKIREIKKRYNNGKVLSKDVAYLEQTMMDPHFSAYDLREKFQQIADTIDDPVQKAIVTKNLIECHKLVHGTTVNVNQKNLNINVDIDVEKVKEHLDKLFGGQE